MCACGGQSTSAVRSEPRRRESPAVRLLPGDVSLPASPFLSVSSSPGSASASTGPPLAASAAVLALLALGGCGQKTVAGTEVAKQVSSKLTAQVGQKPDKVTCPDLAAQKGKSATCKLTDGGKTYDTKVTVTSVEGSNVKFAIKVANQPN